MFGARDGIAGVGAPGACLYVVKVIARLGLRDGYARDHLTRRDPAQEFLARRARDGEQRGRERHRPQIRTGEERAAETLHGDHEFGPATAGAADALGDEGTQHAHLRQPRPGLAAVAGIACRQAPALRQGPAFGQPPGQALAKDPLVFAQKEIPLSHRFPRAPARPWPRYCAGSRWSRRRSRSCGN